MILSSVVHFMGRHKRCEDSKWHNHHPHHRTVCVYMCVFAYVCACLCLPLKTFSTCEWVYHHCNPLKQPPMFMLSIAWFQWNVGWGRRYACVCCAPISKICTAMYAGRLRRTIAPWSALKPETRTLSRLSHHLNHPHSHRSSASTWFWFGATYTHPGPELSITKQALVNSFKSSSSSSPPPSSSVSYWSSPPSWLAGSSQTYGTRLSILSPGPSLISSQLAGDINPQYHPDLHPTKTADNQNLSINIWQYYELFQDIKRAFGCWDLTNFQALSLVDEVKKCLSD